MNRLQKLASLIGVLVLVGVGRLTEGVAEAACAGTPSATWITPGGGAFGDPANWSGGQLPGPGDIVCIDKVNGNPVTVALPGAGHVYTSSVDSLSVGAGSTLTLAAQDISGAWLKATGTITNDGTINLTSVPVGVNAILEADGAGGITNSATGLIASLSGNGPNGGSRAILGNFTNNGTLTINRTVVWEHVNTGTNILTNNGLITIAAGQTLAFLPGLYAFNQVGGTGMQITDPGAFSFSGPFTYSKGSFSGNPPVLLGGSTLTFVGATTDQPEILIKGQVPLLSSIPLGAVVRVQSKLGDFSSGAVLVLSSSFSNNGEIWLDSVSTDPRDCALLSMDTASTLTNVGKIKTLVGTGGCRTINGNLTNPGIIDLLSSTTFGNGTPSVITNTGTITVEPGATATFLTAQTTLNQNGGTVTISDTDGLRISNGTLNFNLGTFPAKPPLIDYGNLNYGAAPPAGGTVVVLTGTLGTDIPAGQLVDIQGRAVKSSLSSNTSFTNRGTLLLEQADAGAAEISVFNSLTLTNGASGLVTVAASAAVKDAVHAKVVNLGTVNVNHDLDVDDAISNAGTVTIGAGATLTSYASYVQTAGLTKLVAATSKLNGATFGSAGIAIQGGTLGGFGVVTGKVVNGGEVSPGASPGALTITGDYAQQDAGSLTIELGGLTAGTQHDQLIISGIATLSGSLNVSLVNGFNPADADVFHVVTYASHAGTFAPLVAPAGHDLVATYGTTDVTLSLPRIPVPDSGMPDAGVDAGTPDAGAPDAGVADAGGADAGQQADGGDAKKPDTGCGCASFSDAPALLAFALVVLQRRVRRPRARAPSATA